MTSRTKLLVAVLGLVAVGFGVAAYKAIALGVPFYRSDRIHEWQIEARVAFLGAGNPVVKLALPASATNEQRGQVYGSLNYSFDIDPGPERSTALWSSNRRDDGQVLYYRVRVQEKSNSSTLPITQLDPTPIDVILPSGASGRAAETIIHGLKARSSYADAIFSGICNATYAENLSQEALLVMRYYEREMGSSARIVMASDLLNAAGVPARIAHGLLLDPVAGAQHPIPMIEYHDGTVWKVRDPLQPSAGLDPSRYFVWHRGGGPLLEVSGGENSKVTFTVAKDRMPLSILTDLQDSPILISTIMGLPIAERTVFRYLVLIPLGAFVVVVMRNIIGVPTLGTFMPVLIALAFLEMPVGQGLVMFSILTAVGLWIRFLLSRLNLLVVPRVAACVVIVTLLMMLMSVVGYKLGIKSGGQITLFPMIILAWTIERMSLIWEEEGKRSALTQVAGSLLVAVLAFLFMSVRQVQYWAFYFPELLLVLLAGILLIGRYTGYRLAELFRFKSFADA